MQAREGAIDAAIYESDERDGTRMQTREGAVLSGVFGFGDVCGEFGEGRG